MSEQLAPEKVADELLCSIHKAKRTVEVDCSTCRGDGSVFVDDDPGMPSGYVRCWSCGGRGVSPFLECWLCVEEGDDY